MNTLVRNLLGVSAFLFAIGAAFTSTTANIATKSARGLDGFNQCVLGSVSASCTLSPIPGQSVTCAIVGQPTVTALNPAATDCTGNKYRRPQI